jgi:hypothetical protein
MALLLSRDRQKQKRPEVKFVDPLRVTIDNVPRTLTLRTDARAAEQQRILFKKVTPDAWEALCHKL